MRAIDYFDRGHDRDPQRLAIIDTASGLKLTFAEVKELTERIAAALQRGGFRNQDLLGLYGPNDGMLLVALLAGPMLGEWVGPRRLVAIVVGFIGVLVVLRPGFSGLHPAAFLSVLGCVCYALYAVWTRQLAAHDAASSRGRLRAAHREGDEAVFLPAQDHEFLS